MRDTTARAGRRSAAGQSLIGAAGYAGHGIVFFGLAVAVLIHFGEIFLVIAAVMAVISTMSLRDAWLSFKSYLLK